MLCSSPRLRPRRDQRLGRASWFETVGSPETHRPRSTLDQWWDSQQIAWCCAREGGVEDGHGAGGHVGAAQAVEGGLDAREVGEVGDAGGEVKAAVGGQEGEVGEVGGRVTGTVVGALEALLGEQFDAGDRKSVV